MKRTTIVYTLEKESRRKYNPEVSFQHSQMSFWVNVFWHWQDTSSSSFGTTRHSIVDYDICSPCKQGKTEKEVRKKWALRIEQLVAWIHQSTNSMPPYHCLDQKRNLTVISNTPQVWQYILFFLQLNSWKHRSQTKLNCPPFALGHKCNVSIQM